MRIDDRFDLLRIHLEAPYVDHAALASQEKVAAGALLKPVPGVDRTVGSPLEGTGVIAEVTVSIAGGAHVERVCRHGQPCPLSGGIDEARGEACQTVAHLERHSGLRRGEGMRHDRLRVRGAQSVEYRLISDLPREPHVTWGDRRGRATH